MTLGGCDNDCAFVVVLMCSVWWFAFGFGCLWFKLLPLAGRLLLCDFQMFVGWVWVCSGYTFAVLVLHVVVWVGLVVFWVAQFCVGCCNVICCFGLDGWILRLVGGCGCCWCWWVCYASRFDAEVLVGGIWRFVSVVGFRFALGLRSAEFCGFDWLV